MIQYKVNEIILTVDSTLPIEEIESELDCALGKGWSEGHRVFYSAPEPEPKPEFRCSGTIRRWGSF